MNMKFYASVILIYVILVIGSSNTAMGWIWCNGYGTVPPWGDDPNVPDFDVLDWIDSLINPALSKEPVYLKTGEYDLSIQDIVVHGCFTDVMIKRRYRNRSEYNSRFGFNWDMNYNMKIFKLNDPNDTIILLDGENHMLEFPLVPGSNPPEYKGPPGSYDYLIDNEDGTYTLVKKHGTKLDFDEHGNLSVITDRNGNSITFAYEATPSILYGPSKFCLIMLQWVGGRGPVSMSYKLQTITIDNDPNRAITFGYNPDGLLSTITDYTGRAWTYTYDPATNDLLTVTSPGTSEYPSGLTTTYTYDTDHNLLTITDPNSQTYLTNHYDAQKRVNWQTYGYGTATFTYNPDNSYTIETSARGIDQKTIYDDKGRPLSEIIYTEPCRPGDPPSYTTRCEYNSDGEITKKIFPTGNFITYTYDPNGNGNVLTMAKEPNNGDPNIVTTFTYDPNFNFVKTATDPCGRTTTCDYDPNGNLIQITYPAVTVPGQGQPVLPVVSFTYNEYGQVETVTDPNRMVTEYQYYDDTADPNNHSRLWKIIVDANENDAGHLDITTQFKYDKWGNVKEITDPNLDVTTFKYNELGLLKQTQTPSPYSNVTNFYYNNNKKLSQLERVRTGDDQETSYTYDKLDKLKTITNPLSYVTTNSYDASENLSQLKDAEDNSTNYSYDERNLPWKVTDANNGVTEYSYTLNGRLAKIKDPNGDETTYTYDKFDRLTTVTYPDTTTEVYGYDKNSNITSKKNRKNETIYYEYDELNRLKCKTRPSEPNTVYRYDIAGRVYDVTDGRSQGEGGGTTTYHYDRIGRVVQVDNPDSKVVKYEYNDRGLRTKLTYPDDSYITYEYDAMGRLTAIKDSSGSPIAEYSYDELSRREKLTLANDANAVYEYDLANRLTKLTNRISSSQSIVFRYDNYDNVGNRLSFKIDDANAHTYTYDMLYELTNVNYHDGNSTAYGYDKLGSRTSVDGTGYLRNSLNQYISVGGVSYGYDNNGNLTSINGDDYEYVYDCENRLIEAKENSSTIATYKYDYKGRRVIKTAEGTTIKYVYDGDRVAAEYENGDLVRKFIYGPGIDEPICMIAGASTYYYHFDGLGSVAALSDNAGNIVEKYSYDVFGTPAIKGPSGEPRATSAISNAYMFTGRAYDDETGNYYYRARYYKPSIGRFLQKDPVGYFAGLNLYTYCGNNPINFIDPWGLAKITIYVQEGTPGGDPSSKEAINAWGHAWVEVVNDSGEKTNSGLYPGGKHDDSQRNKNADVVYPIEITDAQAEAAKKYIQKYDGKYNEVTENCTDYVYKVVEKGAGQDIPGSDWGIDYPDKLAEDLKKKQAEEKKSK